MPTLNHDSFATAANPTDDAVKQRSRRIMGVSLGATLITVFVLFAAMALAPVDASAANTCTLTSTSPVTLWGDVTKWSGCGGTYPGQGAGDTAIVTLGGGYTLKVDAFNNPVTLQISGSASSIPIQVASGGTLTLETSSTATSSNTFTVDIGGTMGTNSGANIAGFQANVHVNGGTFTSDGTIALTSGTFTFSGGNLNGTGTINITNSGIFDGAVGAMSISGTTINDSGFVSYTSTTNPITLSGSAKINVTGAGQFSIATDAAINGTASETISVASGASMQKTSGTGFNVISPFVKNDGTVNVSGAGAGGGFGFQGSGTHSGSFVTGSSSQTIAFGGNNTFNSGAAFSGPTAVKFVNGTQTFPVAVTASGGIKWAGGTIAGTGPLTVSGTSTLDGSNSGMQLTGVINNTGAMTYTAAPNALTINGASAKLETTSGSFIIAGDYDVQAVPPGAGTLRAVGGTATISKISGATGSSILANVDNAGGTVTNSATGALNFAGGGKSTGTMSVPAAANTMNFTNGTFDDNGAVSGAGIINVAGGTLNINTATSFGSGTPNFNLNGGTLGGTGTVSILSASNWTSGTITGSSPFNVSSTGTMAITGALGPMALDGRVFNDNSSVVYNSPSNNLTLKNSASIINSGTFTAIGSGTIDTDGSAVSFTNNGQFSKTNSSLFIVKPQFNNNGTGVSITGGVLALDGDGTSTAPWNMSAGTEVWFPVPFSQTYTWAPGTTFSGGKVTIDAGNVATTAAMTINNTNLELNGGTLTTPFAFTITTPATFKWKSGTLAGAGHTIISSGTTFDMLTEFGARSMTTHVIDNAGNATMSAVTQPINLNSSSVFNNTGTLDIQSDGSMLTDGAGINLFTNTGTVKKTVGGSGFRFDVQYTQSAGTTDANSATPGSTIIFNNGGTLSGGALQATSSTNFVDFFNGTFNVNGGSLNNGQPGALRLTGSGAAVSINVAKSATNFIQNFGTLQGSANLTIPSGGTYTWNG